jgi:NADH:ubiquinone oxidoreductase subunit 3 (subunit A)
MEELVNLWLPIVVSAVLVFFASFIAWTVSTHHKPDWKKLPNEERVMEEVRGAKVSAGQYMFPYCDPSEMKDPTKKARYEAGPHGTVNVWPGPPNMGMNMVLTLVFFLVTSIFVAYLTSVALDPGARFAKVFQVAGTAAIMAYCFAFIPNNIWFHKPLRAVVMDILDGVVYGLITGATFGLLWPKGSA